MTKYDELIEHADTLLKSEVSKFDALNTVEKLTDAIRELRAENEALRSCAICAAVKTLEWTDLGRGLYFEARSIGILYSVRVGSDGIVRWQAGYMGHWLETSSVELAKSAAQADYERRILSTLTIRPEAEVRNEGFALGWKAAIEACAKKRAGKPRDLNPIGTGMLLGEQQYGFNKGWKEASAAMRESIRTITPPAEAQAALDAIKARTLIEVVESANIENVAVTLSPKTSQNKKLSRRIERAKLNREAQKGGVE